MVPRLLDLKIQLKYQSSAFLFGPRGTGKTMLAREYLAGSKNTIEIDMLSIETLRRYVTTPRLFAEEILRALQHRKTTGALTVFIDEVQKFPEILNEVHALIEKYKNQINFLLTGSSARKLKREGANLLAGRAFTLYLHPFSSLEVPLDLTVALQYGTLPQVFTEPDTAEPFLKAYIHTYLKEEILQEALTRKVENFYRFLDLAAQHNGEPINFSKLAKQCGVSTKTAQEYFSILEDTLLVLRLPGWHPSVKKQLLQAPKFYFFDCGVLNTLSGELRSELKVQTFRYGPMALG